MKVLALNAGSSSVKFAILDASDGIVRKQLAGEIDLGAQRRASVRDAHGHLLIDRPWDAVDPAMSADGLEHTAGTSMMDTALDWIGEALPMHEVQAIGHRIVMGGVAFDGPVRIDDEVVAQLDAMLSLAPLHQPACMAGVRGAVRRWPRLAQVACLDTAFHRNQPWHSQVFALPRRFYDEGVRRFGFHGLSYAHLARRLAQISPEVARGRVIAAHLGNGASMCAMKDGQSVASTMGFSALDGLPMGTRCGQIDPGVLLWLMQAHGWDAERISNLLYRESGLKGLSGISGDMRALQASDAPQAAQAIDYYVHRARRELGALAAVLGGVDGIVFTAGVGEHSATIRAAILSDMQWLGIQVDARANASMRAEGRIDAVGATVQVWVIPADEESTIAHEVIDVLQETT